jgi:serine-type D-Ala-D-Ala carboxypeptidase/endopeptidase
LVILAVTREANQLFGQATGQPKFELYPESTHEFFLKIVDAQVTFETDASGRATSLTLHQNGKNVQAKRVHNSGMREHHGHAS